MARKTSKQAPHAEGNADAQQAVRDSAQKIWLAGLGAFERAKSEGPKMFETLVEQGRSMGAKAVGAADEAMKNLRSGAGYGAGQWDKLEHVFEERVSRSLHRLGVLTSKEVDALSKQVEELNATVRSMMARGATKPAAATGAGARKSGARKAGARKSGAKAAGVKKAGAKKKASRASRAPRA